MYFDCSLLELVNIHVQRVLMLILCLLIILIIDGYDNTNYNNDNFVNTTTAAY